MMAKFLEELAQTIIKDYPDNTGDICVVLPNRRAGLFLKKYLAAIAAKTMWLPDIFSIEDFVYRFCGSGPVDDTELLFDLYDIHCRIEADKARPLEEFIKWGRVLLDDFGEIDMQLVDANALYTHLTEAKAIALWNPGESKLTNFEAEYLRFYRSLHKYYAELNQHLTENKKAYPGLAFRNLAENIADRLSDCSFTKIIFAGFNALSHSEEKIFKYLLEERKAIVLWDVDEFYLSGEEREAGLYLRKHFSTWHQDGKSQVKSYFGSLLKNITISGVPGSVNQARHAGRLVDEMIAGDKGIDRSNVALVLADEKLLMPVLNSLPSSLGEFNITMGFPMSETPCIHLVEAFFSLYENAERIKLARQSNELRFQYRDILRLLLHPYVGLLLRRFDNDNRSPDVGDIVNTINESNRIFYSPTEIITLFGKESFALPESFKRLINCVVDRSAEYLVVLSTLGAELSILSKAISSVDVEALNRMQACINQLAAVIGRVENVSIRALRTLLIDILSAQKIPFYGEPLQGLQILGMLETRTLDFDTVILLSVNEGFLPSSMRLSGFIPLDVRIAFGLPAYTEKEAVMAYHFYRLLQRCSNVHLVYNTESGDLGGGEKSRYLEQIIHEFYEYETHINITSNIINSMPAVDAISAINVRKDSATMKFLVEKASYGFSPSVLNTYRQCSLKFYFQEVLGMKQPDESGETMDSARFGSVVHAVLEKIFGQLKGKTLTVSSIDLMFPRLDQLIKESFDEKFPDGDVTFGKNLLITRVCLAYIKSLLIFQKEEILKDGKDVVVAEVEKSLKFSKMIATPAGQLSVVLKGIVDRIDSMEGTLRIIDYKTGAVKPTELNMADWDFFKKWAGTDKAFQILMYAYLCRKTFSDDPREIESGIISIRKLSGGFMSLKLPGGLPFDSEGESQFNNIIDAIIAEIFDAEQGFIQTKIIEDCKYCSYTGICRR